RSARVYTAGGTPCSSEGRCVRRPRGGGGLHLTIERPRAVGTNERRTSRDRGRDPLCRSWVTSTYNRCKPSSRKVAPIIPKRFAKRNGRDARIPPLPLTVRPVRDRAPGKSNCHDHR